MSLNGIRRTLLAATLALAGLSPPPALPSPEHGAPAARPPTPTPDQLADAIQGGRIGLVQAMLQGGAEVNSVTSTARHWPDSRPAEAGISIDPGTTLLSLAIDYKRRDIARLLIAAGADVNEPDANPRALRPLQTAARTVSTCCLQSQGGQKARQQLETADGELVSLLLAHGALVDARDGTGYSALHYAAASDNVAAVERLIAAGAPVDSTTGRRTVPMPFGLGDNPFFDLPAATPLILAVHWRAQRAAGDLLMRHANINARTRDGLTPLLLAVAGDDAKMVVFLVDNGADVNLAASTMRRPYDQPPYNQPPVLVAQSYVDLHPEYLEITGILTSHGAHLDPITQATDAVRRAFYECCYLPLSH